MTGTRGKFERLRRRPDSPHDSNERGMGGRLRRWPARDWPYNGYARYAPFAVRLVEVRIINGDFKFSAAHASGSVNDCFGAKPLLTLIELRTRRYL